MQAEVKAPLIQTGRPKPLLTQARGELHARTASLTDVEMAFLSALLIDKQPNETEHEGASPQEDKKETSPLLSEGSKRIGAAASTRVLDNQMLFNIPRDGLPFPEDKKDGLKRPLIRKKPQQYRFLVGLWQAFEDGVSPKQLSSLPQRAAATDGLKRIPEDEDEEAAGSAMHAKSTATFSRGTGTESGFESVRSDEEIRDDADDVSDISWDDEEVKHFDAWQVLKDEYALDFGFDYSPDGAMPGEDDELEPNTFKILGTSADDKSAHPHVLSPPLMDAIINFVPEHLRGQNLWMKYSLVRDGASLDTLKQYARASKDTVLAIETTKGQVFGCYTSRPWRTAPSFYGGSPSFVFKMRYNRDTPCHSLIEQAQMESEIDVFFLLEDGQRPQLCTHGMIGVGEGYLQKYDQYGEVIETMAEVELKRGKNYGFAVALQDDLLAGTTSKCSSYKNPCLVDPESNGEAFQVLNLEVWTFTPCFSLETAQQLEITQFFLSESMRNMSIRSSTSTEPSVFSSQDLSRDQFYRRVGQNDDHEELRERWQYRNMMDGGGVAGPRAMGATPRFNNSTI